MFLLQNYNLHLFFHRICKLLGITVLTDNVAGIKAYNKKKPSFSEAGEETDIAPAELLLGFDGLADEYTLTGVPVNASPHYELLKLIKEDKDISCCDYIKRETTGCLDGRFPIKADIPGHTSASKKTTASVAAENYKPPLVYLVNDSYYILDGKHRCAAAALSGTPVRCRLIPLEEIRAYSYHQKLYKKMQKNPDKYSRNLALLHSIYR